MKPVYNLGDPNYGFYWDTNMYRPFSIAPPSVIAIQEVGLLFSPTSFAPVRNRFIEKSCLELWIGQRNYFRAPCAALFQVGKVPFGRNASNDIEGLPAGQSVKAFEGLDMPILVDHQDVFHWTLQVDPFQTSQKLKLWVAMRVREGRGVN